MSIKETIDPKTQPEEIRRIIKSRGFSNSGFVHRLSVDTGRYITRSMFDNRINGKVQLEKYFIEPIAELLGISVETVCDLFGFEDK